MESTRADEIVARRDLRRKVGRWRFAAIVLALLAVGVLAWRIVGLGEGDVTFAPQIARIAIEGTITEDDELLDRLERIAESEAVKGVLLQIDSPGGTSVGGETIHLAVRKIAEKKPVVAEVGTLAASAGYMIAAGADHIVARQSSIVGSIGVLIQYPNVRRGLDKLGIEVDAVKSTPLKAEPSPFNETTPAERLVLQNLVDDIYEWFVGLVAERRPLSVPEVRALATGAVFSGRQAVDNRLVDELGGEETAIAWLESRGVPADLQVVDWKGPEPFTVLGVPVGPSSASVADLLGAVLPAALTPAWLGERASLEGALSIWQPGLSQ